MVYTQTFTLQDVDLYMKEAYRYYLEAQEYQAPSQLKEKGPINYNSLTNENLAYQALDSMTGSEAARLKVTLIQPVQLTRLMQLEKDPELLILQSKLQDEQTKYDNFMSRQYYPLVNSQGAQQADTVKQEYSNDLEKAKHILKRKTDTMMILASSELDRIVKGFPDRKKKYDAIRTPATPPVVYTLKDADDEMFKAYESYSNKDQRKQLQAEVNAYSILNGISGQQAKRLKSTLLQPDQVNHATNLQTRVEQATKTYDTKNQQYTTYMSDTYALNIQTMGAAKADAIKEDYDKQKNRAFDLYQQALNSLNIEYTNLTQGFPLRKKNYDLTKLEVDPQFKDTPIVEMNTILSDLMVAYPESNPSANIINQQVHHIYDNYQVDISYAYVLDTVIADISNNALQKLERDLTYKKRTMDIQEYYDKNYQQQIVLMKIVLFFSLLALFGGLLLNYEWIGVSFFAVYLGVVLAVGFILLFYYLWDYYLRDTTNFDEYNFLTYHPPPKPALHDDNLQNLKFCDSSTM